MAISLKKHTPGAGEQESARLNDVNQNWGTIEQAINDLQANASLLDITATFTNGLSNIPAATLGVNDVYSHKWIVQLVTTSSLPTWLFVPVIRLYSTVLTVYLRTISGGAPPDGDYRLFIYRD